MMNRLIFRTSLVIANIFVGCVCMTSSYAADQSESAKQALEQLRLLQQRLSAPASNTKDATSSPIPKQLSVQTPLTTVANAQQVTNEPQLTRSDQQSAEDIAFNNLKREMFPLTPEQVIQLKQRYHTDEFAKASPAGTPPKPVATSQFVNLSPGSTPPAIRLAQGFVSSLVFLDSTGAPWPITAYDLGDPTAFNIQWDRTGNTMMIQSNKLYNYGNLAVRLQGLNTPVMLTLIPGQKAVDYRVDLRIQGHGPNAITATVEDGLPPSANNVLLHILDGVPPAGSTRLTVSGGDARGWLMNEKMYVRTNLTVLSPGWLSSMTSADGMHAYEMQKSPVILVSWHGKVMQLKVEGL